MKNFNRYLYLCLAGLVMLVMAACSPASAADFPTIIPPSTRVPSVTPGATTTPTLIPVGLPTATETSAPTATKTATAVPTATFTPLPPTATLTPVPPTATATQPPTATPTVCSPGMTARVNVNLRAGPGTNYAILRALASGTSGSVIARNSDGSWYEVVVGGVQGWVSAPYVNATCVANLPVVTVPAPPATATSVPPTATAVPPTATPTMTAVPGASVHFYASATSINAGQCVTISWDVDYVKAVYFNDGNGFVGVVGHDSRSYCLYGTTTFSLIAIQADDTPLQQWLTINVAPTPTPTATNTPTNTPTKTATPTATKTATPKPTATATATKTATPKPTATATATKTATLKPTATATVTKTATLKPTATKTATPTSTPTKGAKPTLTPTLTTMEILTGTASPSPFLAGDTILQTSVSDTASAGWLDWLFGWLFKR